MISFNDVENRMSKNYNYMKFLSRAQSYAELNSTCEKVHVGSMIIPEECLSMPVYGCNRGLEYSCKNFGCNRVKMYGENSKQHRLPSDCVAIHSEVDAICKAAMMGIELKNAMIFVTRYPCEACARAIAVSGIKKVVYGRSESISKMTEDIFKSAGVETVHVDEWSYYDNNL